MLRKSEYRDMEKYRETREKQKKRYYAKTECGRHRWQKWQDDLIIAHEMADHQLAKIVGHSVKATQVRRARLKKMIEHCGARITEEDV